MPMFTVAWSQRTTTHYEADIEADNIGDAYRAALNGLVLAQRTRTVEEPVGNHQAYDHDTGTIESAQEQPGGTR